MKRVICAVLCLLALHVFSGSRTAQAAPPVAPGFIAVTSATASTSYQTRSGWMSANGNGITEPIIGAKYAVHGNTDVTMWLNNNTDPSTDWVQYDLGAPHNLSEMWVWNGNQNGYIQRGLKNIYIEYKVNAGDEWSTLTQAGNKTFTLAQSTGASALAATNQVGGQPVSFGGVSARYVRIRPAGGNSVGNYQASTATEKYSGLSEVRFYEGAAPQFYVSAGSVNFPPASITSQTTMPLVVGAFGGSGKLTLNKVSFRSAGVQTFSFVTTPTLNKVFNAGEMSTCTLAFRPRVLPVNYASTLTLSMTVNATSQTLDLPLTGKGVIYYSGFIPDVAVTAVGPNTGGGRSGAALTNNAGFNNAELLVGAKASMHDYNAYNGQTNMWMNNNTAISGNNTFVEFDLGKSYNLGEMWVWNYSELYTGTWYNTRGVKACRLYTKVNAGDPWTQFGTTVTLAQAPNSVFFKATNQLDGTPVNFGGLSTRYVRLEIASNWGGGNYIGLGEVRFYETGVTATQAYPVAYSIDNSLGSIPVDKTTTFTLAVGSGAIAGTVSLDSASLPADAPVVISPALAPRTFNANTTASYMVSVRPQAAGAFNYPLAMTMSSPAGVFPFTVTIRGTGVAYEPSFIRGVTATSNQSNKAPVNAVNSSGMTEASGVVGSKGATSGNSNNNLWRNDGNQAVTAGTVWIQFDLGKIYNLGEMWVWNYNEISGSTYYTQRGIKNCTITYSTDGTNWTTLGGTGNTFNLGRCANSATAPASNLDGTGLPVDFAGTAVRYVKVACNSTWEKTTGTGFVGLSEVRFYTASLPTLTVNPGALTFDPVNTDFGSAPTTKTLTISNTGDPRTMLDFTMGAGPTRGLNLVGADASDYQIVGSSRDLSQGLAGGQSATITIKFAPPKGGKVYGSRSATLRITPDDYATSAVDVSLGGIAVPVELSTFAAE